VSLDAVVFLPSQAGHTSAVYMVTRVRSRSEVRSMMRSAMNTERALPSGRTTPGELRCVAMCRIDALVGGIGGLS